MRASSVRVWRRSLVGPTAAAILAELHEHSRCTIDVDRAAHLRAERIVAEVQLRLSPELTLTGWYEYRRDAGAGPNDRGFDVIVSARPRTRVDAFLRAKLASVTMTPAVAAEWHSNRMIVADPFSTGGSAILEPAVRHQVMPGGAAVPD
jgi:hypothetical protein